MQATPINVWLEAPRPQTKKAADVLSPSNVQSLFDKAMNDLNGDRTRLEYGKGKWLELIEGSEVLPTVVARCFQVCDSQNRVVQGPVAVKEVAKSIVRLDPVRHPRDFQELVQLINDRVLSE